MMVRRLIITTLTFISTVSGAIPLDAEKVLSFNIAQKGINRITIEGDFIDNVFVYPEERGSSVVLHPKGHIYIPGQTDINELDIGILTRSGKVQDLHLTFTPMKAQPLLFVATSQPGTNKPTGNELSTILQTCVRGRAPSAYPDITRRVDAEKLCRKTALGKLKLDSVLRASPSYQVLCYTFHPAKDMPVDARSFKAPTDIAVVASTPHTTRGTPAYIYVIQKLSKEHR